MCQQRRTEEGWTVGVRETDSLVVGCTIFLLFLTFFFCSSNCVIQNEREYLKFHEEMKKRTGGKTFVPQTMVDDHYFGGLAELIVYFKDKPIAE